LLLLAVVNAFLAWYVGSYAYLSRCGLAEARKFGFPGIFYVAWRDITGPDSPGLARHHRRARFYAPLNVLDCAFFGGRGPVRSITWGLSRAAPPLPGGRGSDPDR